MNLFQARIDDERGLTVTLTGDGRLWIGRGRMRLGGLFTEEVKRPGDCPEGVLRQVTITRGVDPVRLTTFAVEGSGERLRWIEWAGGTTSWDVAPRLAAVGGGAGGSKR